MTKNPGNEISELFFELLSLSHALSTSASAHMLSPGSVMED